MAIEITSESLAGAQPEPAADYKQSSLAPVSDFQVAASVVCGRDLPNKFDVDPTQL